MDRSDPDPAPRSSVTAAAEAAATATAAATAWDDPATRRVIRVRVARAAALQVLLLGLVLAPFVMPRSTPGWAAVLAPMVSLCAVYGSFALRRRMVLTSRMRSLLKMYPWRPYRGEDIAASCGTGFAFPDPAPHGGGDGGRITVELSDVPGAIWWLERLDPSAPADLRADLRAELDDLWYAGDPRYAGVIALPGPYHPTNLFQPGSYGDRRGEDPLTDRGGSEADRRLARLSRVRIAAGQRTPRPENVLLRPLGAAAGRLPAYGVALLAGVIAAGVGLAVLKLPGWAGPAGWAVAGPAAVTLVWATHQYGQRRGWSVVGGVVWVGLGWLSVDGGGDDSAVRTVGVLLLAGAVAGNAYAGHRQRAGARRGVRAPELGADVPGSPRRP
ncbi:hypothetical protein [Streptomyces boninensis]|uniref:hypothetical protein n=1 Tax=Streptomyces boninensis TaxID=2039455 RepID=UPI003B20EE65